MKVLIYSHAFAPKIGGVETYVMLLAQGLAERAVHVTLVTPTPADGMNDSGLPFRVVRRPSSKTLLRQLWAADVIHVAGPCLLPMLLGLAFRKPVVVEHHGYQAVCPNGLLFYEPTKTACPTHFTEKRYNKCLRCNATNSDYFRSLAKLLLTFPRRQLCNMVSLNAPISHHVNNRLALPRSKVIYYGIRDPLRGTESLDNGQCQIPLPLTLAYVGRLVNEKGVPVFLRAASQLKEGGYHFRLKIVGDGPERENLEEMVTAFGLSGCVGFTGQLQGQSFETALDDVSVVVMATLMEETAGLAAIEHMMRGRLVIASDIGGLGEVVDGVGLKFAAGDISGLRSCLQRVLDDPGLVEVLGKKARKRARELFLQQRMIAEHLAVYRELLGDSSPSTLTLPLEELDRQAVAEGHEVAR